MRFNVRVINDFWPRSFVRSTEERRRRGGTREEEEGFIEACSDMMEGKPQPRGIGINFQNRAMVLFVTYVNKSPSLVILH